MNSIKLSNYNPSVSITKLIVFFMSVLLLTLSFSIFKPEPTSAQTNSCTNLSSSLGLITQNTQLDLTGSYDVWFRVKAPDGASQFTYSIDGAGGSSCNRAFSATGGANSWIWAKSSTRLTWGGGSLRMQISGTKAGVNLDCVVITQDTSYQPVGISGCEPPTDTTAPTVQITSPTSGSTVSNTVAISATASDDVGVTRVSFFQGTSQTPFSTDTTSPYSGSWNSATVANGSHTLRAIAYDAAGNQRETSITVNVQNVVPDTTAPVTSISSPTNGSTVNGSIIIQANASDNVGITRVELRIDGALRATDTTSPYSFSWDTTTVANGSHTLRTTAYDAAGNTAQSTTVTVNVNNVAEPVCEDTSATNYGGPLPCVYPQNAPGDVNGDSVVNVFDLSVLLSNWLRTGVSRSYGDLNQDNIVNIYDLSILLANWTR